MLSALHIYVVKLIGFRPHPSLYLSLWNKFGTMSQGEENSKMNNPVERLINEKLTKTIKPIHLQVVNESYMHNAPKGSESHFQVLIVSEMFNNKPLLECHRLVHEALKEELEGPIHALSIQAKTPTQWDKMISSGHPGITPSPNCRGGFGK